METLNIPKIPTKQIITTTLVFGAGILLTFSAFNHRARIEIHKRAGHKSEATGISHRPLEASHIDHTRDATYNEPYRGLLLSDFEHYLYHVSFVGQAEKIGLTEDQNDFAIYALRDRIMEFNTRTGQPVPSSEQTSNIMQKIIEATTAHTRRYRLYNPFS